MNKWYLVLIIFFCGLIVTEIVTPFHTLQWLRPRLQGFLLLGNSPDAQMSLYQCAPDVIDKLHSQQTLTALQEENSELRQLLQFTSRVKTKTVVANILYRDASSFGYFYIDQGAQAKIQKGQAVIGFDGVLIGRIASVNTESAQVEQVTSGSFRAPAQLITGTTTIGLARGDAGFGLVLELIPNQSQLVVGDTLVTAATDDQLPQGLLLGTVQKIDTTADDLFQRASVLPFFGARLPLVVSVVIR